MTEQKNKESKAVDDTKLLSYVNPYFAEKSSFQTSRGCYENFLVRF